MKVIYKTLDINNTESEISLKALKGQNLRSLLIDNQIYPYNGKAKYINCRGLGSCGTCAVSIEEINSNNAKPDFKAIEKIRLNFPPHTNENTIIKNLRLACQYEIKSDIIVIKNKGFWGQD